MTFRSIFQRFKSAMNLALRASPHTLEAARKLIEIEAIQNSTERYEEQFSFLDLLAAKWDLHIYNRHSMWVDEKEFWNLFNGSSYLRSQRPDRKFVVWSLAKNAFNIPGNTAECGVMAGASSHLICEVFKSKSGHRHRVFDSFSGLSQPAAEDEPFSKSVPRWEAGDLAVPLDVVKKNLEQFDFIDYYKGWIPERFDEVSHETFSFVHIDVDLYEPTKASLEFFYPRLAVGGILLCDDYGSHWCAGARKAFDEFASKHSSGTVIHLPTQQGFIVKREAMP